MKHILLSFALLLTVLGCADTTTTPADKTYKIGMVHWAAYSPLNVADVKGFWTDQNLKVEVINYKSNTDLNAALINGDIDLALDMIGSWVDLHLQGKPIVIAGETDWSNGGDKMIIKTGVDINMMKDGKLGVYLNMLSVKNFVSKFLISRGLTMADFVIEEQSNPDTLSTRFIDGTYGLIANYDPAATRAVEVGGGTVAATSATFPGCIPEGFAMRSDVTLDHSDLVKIFKGWVRAVEWAATPENKAEYFQIMRDKTFPGDDVSADSVLQMNLDQVRIHSKLEQRAANIAPGSLPTYLAEILPFAKANGFPGHTTTAAQVLNTAAMQEALE